jgi:GTPase SAR1 family protein
MKNIDENAPDDVIRVLVGNKSDLHQRLVISTQEGKRLAEKYRVDFFETSAKSDTNSNVSKMFYFITEKLLEHNQSLSKSSTNNIDISTKQSDSTYGSLYNSCCSSATTTFVKK